jgi:hypothetical protein
LGDVDLNANLAPSGALDRATGQARGAQVLHRDHIRILRKLQASFQQELLKKRIADLYHSPV